ncbi:MAG: isocitrate lyase/phosphoenolpyruvate mutase family protein [Acidipila sp.]|nr:isocitrate lyase/phosphoenolpyruvate mutase family protein [Acidipila sp.]
MHEAPPILLLPNAWDVTSARLFEEAGFRAVATTSAGIANLLGYTDGQGITRDGMLSMVERIARALSVPVTADMEAGYSSTPEGAAATAKAVIDAGAVGMNFEDGTNDAKAPLFELELQVARVKAIRAAADAAGVPLVLNARTDVYFVQSGDPAACFDHAVRRANAYRAAGADCLFVPGVSDRDIIARLVRAIHGPINILAGEGTPPVSALEQLGVARVSVGSGPMRATMALTRRIANDLRETGTYASYTTDSISHAKANELVERSQKD